MCSPPSHGAGISLWAGVPKFYLNINRFSVQNPKTQAEYFEPIKLDTADRDKLMKDYSHGMKNKMQLLVNIIAESKLLRLDEPLTSLDVVAAEEMKQLLRSLRAGRITLFSAHILGLALDLCDEIVLLSHGRLERVENRSWIGRTSRSGPSRPSGRKAILKTLRISWDIQ